MWENHHILRWLIVCIKFGGHFKLPLREHDEVVASKNIGIYQVLSSFVVKLDAAFYNTCSQQEILKQIRSSNFISLEDNEATDKCVNSLGLILNSTGI